MTDPVDPPAAPPPADQPYGPPPQDPPRAAPPEHGHPQDPQYGGYAPPPPAPTPSTQGQPQGQPPSYGPPPPPGAYGPPPPPPGYGPQAGYAPQQSGYGPPPGYGAPPGYGPPPAKNRKTLWITIATVVVVAAAAIVAVVLLTGGSSSGSKYALPDKAGSYTRITGDQGAALEKTFKNSVLSGAGSDGDFIRKAIVGVYGKPGSDEPSIAIITSDKADNSALSTVLAANKTPQHFATAYMTGTNADGVKDYPTGTHGGALKCGVGTTDQDSPLPTCIWVDKSTFGITVDVSGASAAAPLAVTTLALRNATEH